MQHEELVEKIVRQVLSAMEPTVPDNKPLPSIKKLDAEKDYPLATKRPEILKTPTGKSFNDITLAKVLNGEVVPEDVRITPETLRMQAEIAEDVGRRQFATNLRRAAELTAVPDERILEIYNALRPYRSSKKELLDIADELDGTYHAKISAALVREAAEVYERRNRLKND